MVRSLCAELARLPDTEVEVATTDADGPGGRLPAAAVPRECSFHVFRRTATERWKYSRGLGTWLRAHVDNFDVVHIHGLWSYASDAAARAASHANVPYIIRPAGMLSDYSFSHRAWNKRLYWRWVARGTMSRAAAFHATSSAERSDIERFCPNAPIHVIVNGVDDGAWIGNEQGRDLRRQNWGVRNGRAVVLFMSRLHPKKGIVELLLPAWAQVRSDAVLVVAGGADAHFPEYAAKVHSEVGRLGLAARVMLVGDVPPQQRWETYDAADLFVLPSHSENFGIVVAEAMARGCPVVVTDQVQACEHVLAADAGTVVPGSVPALVESLTAMLGNANRRKACGASGRRYAEANFRWSQIAACVRQMYEETVQAGHRPMVHAGGPGPVTHELQGRL